jgi:hypothetical protein
MVYSYVMAVNCKVGRPYHVADICFAKDPDRELYDQFYRACRNLTYSETVILARAVKVDVRTVRRWQAGQYFPSRRGTAVLIIGWVDRGKPQKMITQAELAAGMF